MPNNVKIYYNGENCLKRPVISTENRQIIKARGSRYMKEKSIRT